MEVIKRINCLIQTNCVFFYKLQMKLTTIIVLTACFAAAVADVKDIKNQAGRFLSLPNPEKCANRKLNSIELFKLLVD